MKKIWTVLFTTFLLAFLAVVPAQAELQNMWAQVYKDTGLKNTDGSAQLTKINSGVAFWVLAKGTDTLETTYVFNSETALTNPVTAANFVSTTVGNGRVQFRVDPTDSTDDRYVDLVVRDNAGGFTSVIKNFDKYTHQVTIDETVGKRHMGIYRLGVIGTSNSEMYTGIQFLADTMIDDVKVKVITATAGTLAVGIETTTAGVYPTGLINGLSVATAGFVPDPAFSTTATSTKYGALLAVAAANGLGTPPVRSGFQVASTSASYLTVSINSTGGGNSNIFYWFTKQM